MLAPITDDVWAAECRVRNPFGFVMPTRMTVIKLATGGLFVHSPVRFEPALKEALDRLGPCACIVAPNRLHHVFIADYKRAYGSARLFAAPGLPEKRRDIAFDQVLDDMPPEDWAAEIDQVLIGGSRMMREVAFYHRTSHSLIITDTVLNIDASSSLGVRLWARLNFSYNKIASPLAVKLTYRDKTAARASIARILSWDFRRIIPCHGAIIEGDAHRTFENAMLWLGR